MTRGDRSSADVVADVTRSLANPIYNTVFDWVEVDINGYDVVLRGWVTDLWKVEAAEGSRQSIPAVQSVTSKLEVFAGVELRRRDPCPGGRPDLRRLRLHRLHPPRQPPIHLVVRNGELILEGTVRNDAEKMLAQSLASSGTLPFRIVNQLRSEVEASR